MKILDTERLTLRTVEVDDAAFFLALINEPSWLKNINDKGVRTLEQARESILTGPVAMQQKYGFSLFLVALKDGLAPIGLCGLIKRDTLPEVDIGYALFPQYWGQGYAYEAALGVMAYGKNTIGLKCLLGTTAGHNVTSGKLLEKLGFTFEKNVSGPNGENDDKLYRIDF